MEARLMSPGPLFANSSLSSICFISLALSNPAPGSSTIFFLPLLALAALIMFVVWRLQKQKLDETAGRLEQTRKDLAAREHERDLAQEELFRRLYEERELNKEKTQFQSQLAEYEKYAALAQLALGAAHEINNPLLGILSHLELELQVATDPETRTEIDQCVAGAKRISATLRGLVNYARPAPPVLSKIGLHRLVVDTLSFLAGQPILQDKVVENQVPPNLPFLRADANQLSQVLMNLLLNAAEATPAGGRITIGASKLTYVDRIEIRVSDTGCGIPPDVVPHVFEPFFTTKRGKGTGLGLSICYTYVRSHDGEIRVDSVVNRGTTVTLTLPVRPEGDAIGNADEESQMVV
jgi:signal transduction histidine kinase